MKGLILLAVFLVLQQFTGAHAAEPCPQSTDQEWSARCFEGEGVNRRVKPEYLKRLSWNRYGMATILLGEPRELLAVGRNGRVVVPNIRHGGDFDYPNAAGGLGRFEVRDSGRARCGYFVAERFEVVVPPRYDYCQGYRDGEALACQDCVRYCNDRDCHDSVLIGGQGFVLGLRGEIKRRLALPTLAEACSTGKANLHAYGSVNVLQCAPAPDSPFKLEQGK